MTKTQDELLAQHVGWLRVRAECLRDRDEPGDANNAEYCDDVANALAALRSPDPEVERLREEAVEAQIEWRGDRPPKDGSTIYGHSWSPYRWLAYKPSSEQARRGVEGRWQTMNEFGGWENAAAPNEWATQAQIEARAALSSNSGGR